MQKIQMDGLAMTLPNEGKKVRYNHQPRTKRRVPFVSGLAGEEKCKKYEKQNWVKDFAISL